jgi:hypothetical protein
VLEEAALVLLDCGGSVGLRGLIALVRCHLLPVACRRSQALVVRVRLMGRLFGLGCLLVERRSRGR